MKRPVTPPMNTSGMNAATSERLIATMVTPISDDAASAAGIGLIPASTLASMFSTITMASSMMKPTATVRASSESVSIE